MLKKISIVLGSVAVLGILYYGVSPLFTRVVLHEDAPSTATITENISPEVHQVSFLVVGTVGHPAEGSVRVLETQEGPVVRFENFKTINGPDLFVYLSKDLEGKDFIDLGVLKGTEGNINYAVPSNVDITEYRYVLTWCKQFGVLFNYAEIGVQREYSQIIEDGSFLSSTDAQKDKILMNTISTQTIQNNEVAQKTALLANGCFWCVEHDLEKVEGVIDVVSGYAGGTTENPTYENYSKGGHREVVLVTYDANVVTYANLVEHIIKHGDPTDAEGSFGDRGQEYAPVIYHENESEKSAAGRVINEIDALHIFEKPLPLLVSPRVEFWPAEDYHQNYSEKNPVRYKFYRTASGRDAFIKKYWGDFAQLFVVSTSEALRDKKTFDENSWKNFILPTETELQTLLTPIQYEVTQDEGTEKPFENAYNKNYEEGIYVDIVSGEPLFLSKDKYDSSTGWPSFVNPISDDVVTLHEDNGLFTKRTEVRSRHANSHLGHVFEDGPSDRGGKRYCMNSASLRFIKKSDMEKEGYAYLFSLMNI